MIYIISTLKILGTINYEDVDVANRVHNVLPQIAETTDVVYQAFKKGGKIFYIGAGTC